MGNFVVHGEIYLERASIFKQTLARQKSFVLSLGGEVQFLVLSNHELLKILVRLFLSWSVSTLVEDENQLEDRPLLKGKSLIKLYQYIAPHLFEREFYYNQCDFDFC
jgi:shikimate kinase